MSYTSDFLKELEKLSKKTTSTAQKAKRRADITVGKQSEDKFTRDFFTELYKLEEEEALKKNQEKEKTRFDDSNKARSSKKRNGGGGRSFDEEEEDKWGNRKSFVLDSLRGLGAPTASGTLSKKETQSGGGGSFAESAGADRYVDIGGGYKINKKTLTLVDKDHVQIGKYDAKTGIIKSIDGRTNFVRIKEDGSLRFYDSGLEELGFDTSDASDSWFQKGAFSDGYDFGDLSKSVVATGREIGKGIVKGVVGLPDDLGNALAYAGLSIARPIIKAIDGDNYDNEKFEEMANRYIAYDIINEDAVADFIVPDLVGKFTEYDSSEEAALIGRKSTGLAESGGQLLTQAALQYVGVPWWVTSGVSTFGSETENAAKQGATFGEAGFSAAVSALGEIATEKIFGAFKFQGKGLDDSLKTAISRNIKNKTLRTMANFGLDYGGEGIEEVLSGRISAAGQKLSYATDKEIRELFSSEDAWDAFIGGSILGGGTNVANIVKSAVNKVDPVTHLTENEQKVVDRVYQDAVDEAEKDGKKLDGTEKNKLYDGILKNLEKGYISTDIIEEVLGGDTYKQYKDTIDSEDAAMKEFEDLYEGEELEQQKNSFKEHSKLDSIREQLGIEVSDKVKGDRLIESYNEKIRRGQQFTADLTKYSEKAQAVVQKAMNSGVLNNTNRSHELVDLVAKIAGDKGIDFDFTNNEKLKESGFAIEGSTINGFVTKDGVTLNVQSQKALNSVVGHEIAHVLEGTELYNELQKIAFEYAETKGEYKDRLRVANEAYRNVEGYQGVDGFNKIKSEVLADIVGDYLFTDPDFINTLSTNHRNVFQKMYDEVKYLYKIATAGSKEAKELEKLKKAFDNAYRAAANGRTDTVYSISETTDGRQVAVVDNDILSNIDTEKLDKATKDAVKKAASQEIKKFSDGITINGVELIGNKDTRREYTRSNYSEALARKNPAAYLDKMRSASILDDVIQVATDWKDGDGLKYDRDDFVDFVRGNTLIMSGDRTYRAVVLAGITSDGKAVFYDVEDVYPESFELKKSESSTTVSANELPNSVLEDSDADNVAQKRDSVKKQYSLSTDSEGKKLSKGQQEFFKDSKMRDADGNLKVMYHGTQKGGYHIFDPNYSDDGISLFFVDRNDVAMSYSGTSETYAARTFRTADDFNNFFAEIGTPEYEVQEKNGKLYLYDDGDLVAESENGEEIYEEFRDLSGLGYGDVNYKTYLNLTNPLVVEANGEQWSAIKVAPELQQDMKAHFGFNIPFVNTRQMAEFAKANGYDGVIFNNLRDNGGFSNGSEGASTVAIAFESNQVKSVANTNPTGNSDIRYSISTDTNGKTLTKNQQDFFKDSVVRDENGKLLPMYHGTQHGGFTVFGGRKDYWYFSNDRKYANIFAGRKGNGHLYPSTKEGIEKGHYNSKVYTAYLNVKNPFITDDVDIIEDALYWDKTLASKLRAKGYDALMLKDMSQVIVLNANQIKNVSNKNPTSDSDIRYSLSKDSKGRTPPQAVKDRFANSKVVDENGNLQVVYHGTASGEFSIFDKSKGNVEGDFGSGFYFTDDEYDAEDNYEGGGPDFDNKVARLAEQIAQEDDIDYEEAEERAKAELFKGGHKFEVYLNIEKPAIVGKTVLFDGESYMDQYNEEDYEDYDDYIGDVEQLVADDISNIIWEVEKNVDVYSADGLSDVLYEAYYDGGIGIEELKKKINELDLEDSNGNLVGNEVTRQIIESLGYDGIIDPTVSTKFNMGIEAGAKHYIVFKPNQIKAVTNQNPTDNPDIHRSLSAEGEQQKTYGRYNIRGEDVALDIAPVQKTTNDIAPTSETVAKPVQQEELFPDGQSPLQELENLQQQRVELEDRLRSAMNANDYEAFEQIGAEYDEVMYRIEQLEAEESALENDRMSSITDADAPPEIAPYYGNTADTVPLTKKLVSDISKEVKASLGLSNKQMADVRNIITEYSSQEMPSRDDLFHKIKDKFGTYTEAQTDDVLVEAKSTLRSYRIKVDDFIKSEIADYGDLMRRNFGKIRFSKDGIPVDSAYEDLASQFPSFFPSDIISPTDQLMQIIDVANMDASLVNEQDIDNDSIMAVADTVINQVSEYRNTQREKTANKLSREAFDSLLKDESAVPPVDLNRILTNKTLAERRTGTSGDIAPVAEIHDTNHKKGVAEGQQAMWNDPVPEKITRKVLHERIIDGVKNAFHVKGFELDDVLKNAKDLSTFATVDNTPQRVMEKALGYKEGQALADMTVNKVAQNETEGIKWLNSFTDRKNGLLAKISEKYHIKPGSKQSAAAQMYAEGFYVGKNNEIIQYGDAELAQDFPNKQVQENIKGLAKDPRIRQIYDQTLAMINASRARNAYPEIPRLDNYFLHFREMEDFFSKFGLPFNPNDMRSKDLPTDLNGMTVDLKPGQPYFSSAMHREGKRTSFDLLGGLEKYLNSAKNQIYHIDDIQTLRALRNYIADTYGQAKGLENLDELSDEEAQEKIDKVYDSHLSTFAKFLNEEANVLAGKTPLSDRGFEGKFGRKGLAFMNSLNQQVGKNMVGWNISSSLTNFLPVVQTFAKTNKAAFIKAFAQTASNKVTSIFGKNDGFAENSPVIIRRKGVESFYRTPWQKVSDPGYAIMSAVDNISTELIARAKYNELIKKMDSQKAHIETDKWVSRLMGDRSLGQQPQLYNSKVFGLVTKFQLEVRNQLDSMFYDTIQETKASNEEIQNKLARNAKTAAKITSTFVQLAVAQHLFGKAFESVAGYNPAFDIIDVLIKTFGLDDDEEDEDTVLDNVEEGFLALLGDLPYTSTFTGGRIPISSALPIEQFVTGKDDYGNEKSRWATLGEAAPYYLLPGGYGQIKKTIGGLSMFSDELPTAGSYTDSGGLRFPVEDTIGNRVKAGVFGQWAFPEARDYIENERKPLNEKQTQEFIDVDMPIKDYWKYREGLSEVNAGLRGGKLGRQADYINSLDLPTWKKNLLINNLTDRKEPIDLTDYGNYADFEEFDYAQKNPEKYEFLKGIGVSVKDYNKADEETKNVYSWAYKYPEQHKFLEREGVSLDDWKNFDDDSKDAYMWAYENPEKHTVAKAVASDVVEYRKYTGELYDIKADKDRNGKSISGSRKTKVAEYISDLDIDDGAKYILFKSEYPSDDTHNYDIIDYLNGRDDISYGEMKTILTELGFKVSKDGVITWD